MTAAFEPRILGRTGRRVGPLGVGVSYGVPAAAVEGAFEQGVNYLYWGSARRGGFAEALRNLASRRDQFVLVMQSFSRVASLIQGSVERGSRGIGYDHADVLHFRYNAAHPGAESEIFPHLASGNRPGTVAFTATNWGRLLRSVPRAADCYRFVLARPEVDVCLCDPANAREMDEALCALRLGPMTAGELASIRRAAGS